MIYLRKGAVLIKRNDAERRHLVSQWVELRKTMSSTNAARKLGTGTTQLHDWAREFGMSVVPLPRGGSNRMKK